MNENCEKFLEEVLTTERPLSADAARHVAECAACTQLRADAMLFTPPEVPEALDMAILNAAQRKGNLRVLRHRTWFRIVPFAAAAMALIAAGLVIMAPEPRAEKPVAVDTQAIAARAVSDWVALEREGYALDFDLDSCQYAMNNW